MEPIDIHKITVCEERGYVSCFTLGLRTAFNNMGALLRYSWTSILIAVLLPVFGWTFYAGQTDALLRKWIELGYIPEVKGSALKQGVMHCTERNIAGVLLAIGLLLVVLCPLMVMAYLGKSLLIGALISFVVYLVSLPMEVVFMEMNYSDKPLSACMLTVGRGYRNYGQLLPFCFLGCFFVGIIAFLGCIPFITIGTVGWQAYTSHLMGDKLDLPLMFPLIVWLAYALGAWIALVAWQAFCFCRCLMWGSLTSVESVEEIPTEA